MYISHEAGKEELRTPACSTCSDMTLVLVRMSLSYSFDVLHSPALIFVLVIRCFLVLHGY